MTTQCVVRAAERPSAAARELAPAVRYKNFVKLFGYDKTRPSPMVGEGGAAGGGRGKPITKTKLLRYPSAFPSREGAEVRGG